MVLRFILTDSRPGKWIFDPFPSRFQDFGTFPRRLHGLEARYLSGLRPGRLNSDKSGFPGRTEKLRAEKLWIDGGFTPSSPFVVLVMPV